MGRQFIISSLHNLPANVDSHGLQCLQVTSSHGDDATSHVDGLPSASFLHTATVHAGL